MDIKPEYKKKLAEYDKLLAKKIHDQNSQKKEGGVRLLAQYNDKLSAIKNSDNAACKCGQMLQNDNLCSCKSEVVTTHTDPTHNNTSHTPVDYAPQSFGPKPSIEPGVLSRLFVASAPMVLQLLLYFILIVPTAYAIVHIWASPRAALSIPLFIIFIIAKLAMIQYVTDDIKHWAASYILLFVLILARFFIILSRSSSPATDGTAGLLFFQSVLIIAVQVIFYFFGKVFKDI